jgi:hypothetical protein
MNETVDFAEVLASGRDRASKVRFTRGIANDNLGTIAELRSEAIEWA